MKLQQDVTDFVGPLTEVTFTDSARRALSYAKEENLRLEISQLISIFGYEMEQYGTGSKVFTVRPPSSEFGYVNSLGYIRAQIGSFFGPPPAASLKGDFGEGSLRSLAKKLLEEFPQIADIRDVGTDSQRVRLQLPILTELYKKIGDTWFLEDDRYYQRLGQEFLSPFALDPNEELYLTKALT